MDTNHGERAIVLVDMDCFYVQVEQKLCPDYQNKPAAVVQYNTWKGGGIIAVNYEARARGVTRFMRGDEAQKHCPEIHLFRVPEVGGKSDLTRYREAGALVLSVLCEYSDCVERASIDEAYLDMTSIINKKLSNAPPVLPTQLPNTFVVGWEDENELAGKKENQENWLQNIYEEDHLYNDRMLALTAVTVEEMRASVYAKTGYRCSAGIAHNKMLAKLSCGLHKPNKQTLLPQSSVSLLYSKISVNKVRNLGGKLGEEVVEKLKAKAMSDLLSFSESQFISHFGEKTGSWLYKISRGIDNEPVIARQLPKSIGCGKNFPGKSALNTKEKVTKWLQQLSKEMEIRLLKDQENNFRVARSLTITVRNQGTSGFSVISRTCPIYSYNSEKLSNDALNTLQKLNSLPSSNSEWKPPILSLALSASKFEDKIDNACDIQSYFSSNPKTSRADFDKKAECSDGKNSPKINSTESTEGVDKESINPKDTYKVTSNNCILSAPKSGITHFFNAQVPRNKIADSTLNANQEISADVNSDSKSVAIENNTKSQTDIPLISEKSSRTPLKGFFATKLKNSIAQKVDSQNNSRIEDHCQTNETLKNNASNSDISLKTYHDEAVPSTSHEQFNEDNPSSSNLNSNLDPELTNLCDKCNERIPIWEEQEHLDYHVAMELSKEVNRPFAKQTEKLNASESTNKIKHKNFQKGSAKRKGNSKSAQKSKKHSPIQKNTLDSFVT